MSAYIDNTIKDEIVKQCSASGIGKDEVGYMTGFCFAPAVDQQGRLMNFAPAVFVVLSLRRLLIGQPPASAGLPAFGVPPDDNALRTTVATLVRELDARRREELKDSQRGAET